jgi:hypothetical protein
MKLLTILFSLFFSWLFQILNDGKIAIGYSTFWIGCFKIMKQYFVKFKLWIQEMHISIVEIVQRSW